jgi:cytochrome c-type biogenesis protein CcmH
MRMRLAALLSLTAALLLTVLTVPSLIAAQETETNPTVGGELDMLALSPEARAIALKVQCPVCDGQSIAESHSTVAKQMRALLQEKVDAGWTERQVLDFFAERYGSAVLREPRLSGLSLGVWVVPPIALLIGGALVLMVVRQWRSANAGTPQPVSGQVSETEEELVARELARLRREGR